MLRNSVRLLPTQRLRPRLPSTLVRMLALLCMAPAGAWADQQDVFNFFAAVTRMHDNNLFRLAPGDSVPSGLSSNSRADNVTNFNVGGSIDKLLSRQKIHADIMMIDSRFENYNTLNNTGGNARVQWDWLVSDVLTGAVGRTKNRSLSNFRDTSAGLRNIQMGDNAYFRASLMLDPSWYLLAEKRRSVGKNGNAALNDGDVIVEARQFGIRYALANGSELTLKREHSTGTYPNRQLIPTILVSVDNSYIQDDTRFAWRWAYSGATSFTGSVGHVQRKHANVPGRDFAGATGNAGVEWWWSGKTQLAVKMRREIGPQDDLLSSYVVTQGVSIKPTVYLTGKTFLRGNADRTRRMYRGDPNAFLLGHTSREDTTNTFGGNVVYMPMPSLQLSAGVTREKRASNQNVSNYSDTTTNLSLQYSF